MTDAGINDDFFNSLKNDMDKYPGESGKKAADIILKVVSNKKM